MQYIVITAAIIVVLFVGFRISREKKLRQNILVAKNNATVIEQAYDELLKSGVVDKLNKEASLGALIGYFIKDEDVRRATVQFAVEKAKHNKQPPSLKWTIFSILVAQMHAQKGADPSEDEMLMAFAAVRHIDR